MVMSPVSLWVAALAMHKSCKNHWHQHSHQKNSVEETCLAIFPSPESSRVFSSIGRRDFGWIAAAAASSVAFSAKTTSIVNAFDGSGASASSGYNPATKAEKIRGYKQRVIADVRDFNQLGNALAKGEGVDSRAWINFFTTFQRREPDVNGRAFAALVDLRGLPTKKRLEFEGGDGLLLAASFAKQGKPPENTPAVKSWNKLSPTFDAIEAAGKKGDTTKARAAWETTKPLLEKFLADVDLPGDLSDPIYN